MENLNEEREQSFDNGAENTEPQTENIAGLPVEVVFENPVNKQALNGYVFPTVTEESPEYAIELASRIVKSGFAVSKVAISDYKKMYVAGVLMANPTGENPMVIKETGQLLLVDTDPTCATGTYYEVK